MLRHLPTVVVISCLLAGLGCPRPEAASPARADAGAADSEPKIAAEEQAAPVDAGPLVVDIVPAEAAARTGRLALFDVSVQGGRAGGIETLGGRFQDQPIVPARWSDDGRRWRVLAATPIAAAAGERELRLEATMQDGSPLVVTRRIPVEEAPYETSRIQVSKKFFSPSKAQRARIARESKSLARALASASDERLWRGAFARPTDTVETSPFGTLRTYNERKKSRHLGLDLDGKVGDPIRAAQRGRAVLVEDRFYSGGTVILDHGHRLFTMYFHMSAFDVEEGELVDKGQLIGKVGKSGRVTGPHLHFAVKLGDQYVDPKYVLALDLSDDPLALLARAQPALHTPAEVKRSEVTK